MPSGIPLHTAAHGVPFLVRPSEALQERESYFDARACLGDGRIAQKRGIPIPTFFTAKCYFSLRNDAEAVKSAERSGGEAGKKSFPEAKIALLRETMEGIAMSALTLDLDDRLRFGNLPAADASKLLPPEPIKTVPGGISKTSSIERADGYAPLRLHHPQHRPQLEAPKHYMLDLLEMHRGVEAAATREVILF